MPSLNPAVDETSGHELAKNGVLAISGMGHTTLIAATKLSNAALVDEVAEVG
jgi:hypothetical protein